MNNQSPLVPQGFLLEQKNKGRARLKIIVFFILAVHGIGLLALLMQGCKQDKGTSDATADSTAATTNTNPPQTFEATNPVVATNPAPPPVVSVPPTPPSLPAVPQDYAIVQGDTFSALAKKFGVTTKALLEANPGVEPTKLQVGQKIHVPAPVAAATPAPTSATTTPDTAEGEQSYTVKSGDTLSSIAKQFGVRVRAIRSANSLTTDRIIVGQKLKIPAKTATLPAATATNPPSDASSATSTPSTTPAR
jgi:LysM repeat protein